MNKKYLISLIVTFSLALGVSIYAAPASNILRNILPEATQTYEIGTTSALWLRIYTQNASTSALTISGLGNTSTQCLQISNQGVVQVTGSACGAGGGGGGTGADDFRYQAVTGTGADYLFASSTAVGFLFPDTASTTLSRLSFNIATGTQASTTYFNISNYGSTSQLTVSASSTILGLNFKTGTGTAATTTSFGVTNFTINSQTFTNLLGTGLTNSAGVLTNSGVISVSCTTITCSGTNPASFSLGSGVITNTMFANSPTNEFTYAFGVGALDSQNYLTPTSTAVGLLVPLTASSTLMNLTMWYATSSQATSTYFASTYASSTFSTTSLMWLTAVKNCNGASTLDTDANGQIVCGVDASGGGSSPNGSTNSFQYNNAGSLAGGGLIQNLGSIGLSTTTPWGAFSISTTTAPQFVVATSSGGDPLFLVGATTTGSFNYARVSVGASSTMATSTQAPVSGLRDQLTVAGRTYTTARYQSCDFAGSVAQIAAGSNVVSADTSNVCGGFSFNTDTSATLQAVASNYSALRLSSGTVSGNGAGMQSGTPAISATSSPVLEAWVKNPSSQAGKIDLVGFFDDDVATGDLAAEPANGIYLVASSTNNVPSGTGPGGTWWAVARSGSVGTYVDTGVSTTTTSFVNYQHLRVEANENLVTYLIDGRVVATINTNIPTVNLASVVGVGQSGTPATNKTLDFSLIRLWANDPTSN